MLPPLQSTSEQRSCLMRSTSKSRLAEAAPKPSAQPLRSSIPFRTQRLSKFCSSMLDVVGVSPRETVGSLAVVPKRMTPRGQITSKQFAARPKSRREHSGYKFPFAPVAERGVIGRAGVVRP
jgi:hypothetical protein